VIAMMMTMMIEVADVIDLKCASGIWFALHLQGIYPSRTRKLFESIKIHSTCFNKKYFFSSDEDLDTKLIMKSNERVKPDPAETTIEIRKEFPETWLFENLEFGM
jgi:hypothetical protein